MDDVSTQVRRNKTMIDLAAKELDMKEHLVKIKVLDTEKDFFDNCRSKIEKAWPDVAPKYGIMIVTRILRHYPPATFLELWPIHVLLSLFHI